MRIASKLVAGLLLLGFLVVAVNGCKPSMSSDGKLFQTAKPEIKGEWEKATTAAKSNDFALAMITLQRLRALPGITPEQGQAIDRTATALNDAMYDAANKGDEKAKKAISDLRTMRTR